MFEDVVVYMLHFSGRYTLKSGLKGMQSLFEISTAPQVIAINQLLDIKPGLLRSPEDV